MPEERKLVTILFADVTGSTALGWLLRQALVRGNITECSPAYMHGGFWRSYHASNLPRLRRKAGSCVGSLRLSGRRALARA